MDNNNYNHLLPVMCNSTLGRVIGSPSSCILLNGEPSMFFVATPHGTILVAGRAHVRTLRESEIDALLQLEADAAKTHDELYGGADALQNANDLYHGEA